MVKIPHNEPATNEAFESSLNCQQISDVIEYPKNPGKIKTCTTNRKGYLYTRQNPTLGNFKQPHHTTAVETAKGKPKKKANMKNNATG